MNVVDDFFDFNQKVKRKVTKLQGKRIQTLSFLSFAKLLLVKIFAESFVIFQFF